VIEFEGVGFSYGRTMVLRDMTFTLAPGMLHILIGPSGAGKTTLLRLCHGDLEPTEGQVRFFGRPIARRNRDAIAMLRRSVGIVPRDCRFLEHLPLIENIALPLRVCGIASGNRSEDLHALLEWVDLADRVDALPDELSGSERQRAALARAVILSPEVVLADEPTGGLDRERAQRLLALLIDLSRMGKTVLIATHDEELVRTARTKAATRTLTLEAGRIETAGAAS